MTELSDGKRVALAIALDELFVENVVDAVERPADLLARGTLCATCQGYHRGLLDAAGAAAMLRDLAPWLSPDLVIDVLERARGASAADLGCDLVDAAGIAAGADLARAIVCLATDQPLLVPERASDWVAILAPYADRLAAKIASRDTSEELLAAALFDR